MLLRNPSQGNLWYRNSWVLTPFTSFKGYGYAGFGWCRLAGHLSKSKHKSLHPEQAEISRQKIKLGNLPRWVKTRLKHRPTQSWKLALYSSLTGEASKLIFGSFGMEGGNEQRKGDFEKPLFSQASWSSHPVWTKSWLLNASELAFSNSLIGRMMLELPSWQTKAGANQLKIFSRRMPHCASLWAPGPWLIFRSRI